VNLIEFARSVIGLDFAWGETNCVALSMRAFDLQAGTTLFADNAMHMASALTAARWTRDHGLDGLVQLFVAAGGQRMSPMFAAPGDILLGLTADGQLASHVLIDTKALSSTPQAGVGLYAFAAVLPLSTHAIRPGRPACQL
jgi:hypothetical protein